MPVKPYPVCVLLPSSSPSFQRDANLSIHFRFELVEDKTFCVFVLNLVKTIYIYNFV